MGVTTFITIWLTGSFIAYKLIRLDFKKSVNDIFDCDFTWGEIIGFIILSLLFSWPMVIIGLIINVVKGNFRFLSKSKPPKWL